MIPRNTQRRHQGRPGVTRRRQSSRFPDLTLELIAPYLVFRHGKTCEVFYLCNGEAELMACSRGTFHDLDMYEHVRAVALAYAGALHARRRA